MILLTALWSVVTLPFRMVAWVAEWALRAILLVMGFLLMVVGAALWAGAAYILGVPVFLFGMLLTLRALS